MSLLSGLIYAALVLTPCVIALVSRARQADSSEPDVLTDGFI